MTAFNTGDKVNLKTPFTEHFPETYSILALAQAADTYTVDIYSDGIGSDFYIDYLEAA